jgi:hypothetical protein
MRARKLLLALLLLPIATLAQAVHDRPAVDNSLRASNKTLLPNGGTTSGQSLNGICAVRFLDQVEHRAESMTLATN